MFISKVTEVQTAKILGFGIIPLLIFQTRRQVKNSTVR